MCNGLICVGLYVWVGICLCITNLDFFMPRHNTSECLYEDCICCLVKCLWMSIVQPRQNKTKENVQHKSLIGEWPQRSPTPWFYPQKIIRFGKAGKADSFFIAGGLSYFLFLLQQAKFGDDDNDVWKLRLQATISPPWLNVIKPGHWWLVEEWMKAAWEQPMTIARIVIGFLEHPGMS